MSKIIKLRSGLNIKLKGKADEVIEEAQAARTYAVKPTDFPGLTPKLMVKVGHEVKAGSPLFFDKYKPDVMFASPVSGKVVAINRGERRRILEVVVEADGSNAFEEFKKAEPKSLSREDVKEELLKSGLWPLIIQRPYGVVAQPTDTPKAIFVSCFDSAPLAPNYELIVSGQEKEFQAGIDALAQLTDGKVHLGLPAAGANKPFAATKNVEITQFTGKHPVGNVGVQIHHVSPINKGERVWTVNVQDVVTIGRLFLTGKYDARKVIALTGSEVKAPRYYRTIAGANLSVLLEGKTNQEVNERYISGNVLTGTKVEKDNYLSHYGSQVTVIPEGDEHEFFGWALPGVNKFSASKTFLSSLFPKKEYTMTANMNGGERAFVLSEQYEKFLPMDILPVFLLKSIIVNDIDKMEQLGIYEVIEEDLALCEYACTSKIEVQSILRQGINVMIKELG
ncbi:Na(+)-translocating NADH-quinone reductase subunit A [Prolixibacteraceae bacterium JC049]|nr:Na(+)-translocating NADH-quinone reductase subunit A [Prolixibacteraceae bacterium JC049]